MTILFFIIIMSRSYLFIHVSKYMNVIHVLYYMLRAHTQQFCFLFSLYTFARTEHLWELLLLSKYMQGICKMWLVGRNYIAMVKMCVYMSNFAVVVRTSKTSNRWQELEKFKGDTGNAHPIPITRNTYVNCTVYVQVVVEVSSHTLTHNIAIYLISGDSHIYRIWGCFYRHAIKLSHTIDRFHIRDHPHHTHTHTHTQIYVFIILAGHIIHWLVWTMDISVICFAYYYLFIHSILAYFRYSHRRK